MSGVRKNKRRLKKEIKCFNKVREQYAVTENLNGQNLACYTHIGTRAYQQDSFAIPVPELFDNNKCNICVLSDGMGGLEGGEIASRVCVETTITDFYNDADKTIPNFLREEIYKIDGLVANLKDNNGNVLDAGATFIATVFDNEKMYWASVGDSRIYLIRNNTITAFNEDHNYYKKLKERVRMGEITQVLADNDKTKDALISYIGINGVELIDMNEEPFVMQENDIILLCSDGLFKSLSEEAIVMIINEFRENISIAAKMLVYTAVDNRPYGQDNTTVIIYKYNNKKQKEILL